MAALAPPEPTIEQEEAPHQDRLERGVSGGSPVRGILLAAPLGAACWALIISLARVALT